jgi:hypothetical protein
MPNSAVRPPRNWRRHWSTALTEELGLVHMHVEHRTQTGGHEGDGPDHHPHHHPDHDHDQDHGKEDQPEQKPDDRGSPPA